MPELITIGETMAVMAPQESGPLRYVRDYRLRIAGAESNTAIGLAKLGHTAGWISRLGEDEMGYYVLNSVRAEGVDTAGVRFDVNHRTGLMMKQMSAGETSVFYYRENSAASHLCPADLSEEYLASAKILHVTGITPVLSDSCLAATDAVIRMAKEHGLLISFDPNIRRKLWKDRDYSEYLRGIAEKSDIVMLGRDEAKVLVGTDEPEEIIRMFRELGVRYIAVKDGANGAYVADSEDTFHIPAYPCRVIDPIGAGDGFNAAFLAGILEGHGIKECGEMGSIAGALATETTGDVEGYPMRAQLARIMKNEGEIYR